MSITILDKQLLNVISNMSPTEQAEYTYYIIFDIFKDKNDGNIALDEYTKKAEHIIERIVKPMDYQKYHEYFVELHKDAIRVAIEAYKEAD